MQPRSSYRGTYVFGLTSTAFVWSDARRRMTHAPGRMPLLDAMAGVVYLAVNVYTHCRAAKVEYSAVLFCDKSNYTSKIIVAKFAKSSLTCFAAAPDRTLHGADHAENAILALWGYMTGEQQASRGHWAVARRLLAR